MTKTRKIHTWCDQCGKAIYDGDEMWFKASEFYCHIKCLMASFNVKKSNETDKRNLLLREKNVNMMKEIYERRKSNTKNMHKGDE